MSEVAEVRKNVVVSASAMNIDGAVEALRMAVALATGRRAHQVSVLFIGDGVVNGLQNRKIVEYEKYFLAAKAHEINVFVDELSLNRRSIAVDRIRPGWQAVKREAILALLSAADLHIRL